jgi:endonuclease/exonuclease/phosphatase family metal-dependent hydrolase
VFLQEVLGAHEHHAVRYNDWPGKPQHEFIADQVWREVAYGKNAVYRHGHHGNALLSRFPIVVHENEDISAHRSRAADSCTASSASGPAMPDLHCINVHLGLFERGREWQVRALCERIRRRSRAPRR